MQCFSKNGIRDAYSTADSCPLLSIVVHCPVHCCPLLSIIIHCCPLLSIVVIHCGYHRLALDGAVIGVFFNTASYYVLIESPLCSEANYLEKLLIFLNVFHLIYISFPTYVIIVILLTLAPFSADTKNTLIPMFQCFMRSAAQHLYLLYPGPSIPVFHLSHDRRAFDDDHTSASTLK